MPPPLILRIIGDATSILKTNDAVIASNTRVGESALGVGADFEKSAAAQIAAGAKAIEAQRAMVASLTAAKAKTTANSDEQIAATVALDGATAKLNRSLGITTVSTGAASRKSQEAERNFNKLARGALAGSGAFSSMGRSLAFASSGFIAFEVGSEIIKNSIGAAEDLEKAQNSLSVAIQHTGGDLAVLLPGYQETAKAAAQFGISEADATTGLARATVLTGNAAAAQRAYQEALVISKATGKDFNTVLTATAKGQEGITTSLRRYGVLVDSSTSGTAQFDLVMKRFGGQAEANTTSLDQLHASLTNALATIGTALLPEVNKLASGFANWLTKMEESGRLQADVTTGMTVMHDALSPLISGFQGLAKAIGVANDAYRDLKSLQHAGGLTGLFAGVPGAGFGFLKTGLEGNLNPIGTLLSAFQHPAPPPVQTPLQLQQQLGISTSDLFGAAPRPGVFGTAQPLKQFWKTFTLSLRDTMAEAQAALTKSNADDVAEARKEVAQIKALLAEGRLKGPALLQALQLEANDLSEIWSAEAQAAQKRAAAAAAAKAKIQAQIENSIDPIRLEVSLAQAQATGNQADIVKTLRELRAAAYKALRTEHLTLAQQKEAWDQIAQLNRQIKDATTNTVKQFVEPMKLQIALARAQAFNQDDTKILERMKAAALKALRSGKYAGQSLIDLLNEIASINSQLNGDVTTAYGDYKKASLKAETAGLGLTRAQREALEARLSQRGPGGTTPETGTGAAGYVIDPATGRPVKVKGGHGGSGRVPSSVGGPGAGGGYHETITINLNIDGKRVTSVVTKGQQSYRRSNPSSRRGPHAASQTA